VNYKFEGKEEMYMKCKHDVWAVIRENNVSCHVAYQEIKVLRAMIEGRRKRRRQLIVDE